MRTSISYDINQLIVMVLVRQIDLEKKRQRHGSTSSFRPQPATMSSCSKWF